MFNQGTDILGIPEHRIVHSEPVKYEKVPGYTIITTSVRRNDMVAGTGGIGIILSHKAMNLCLVLFHKAIET